MSASVFIRLGLIAAAVIAGAIGFVNLGFAAVIVSETRRISVEPAVIADIDAIKAEYRRPTLIPFPRESPYTLAKAALGKKLYFDPRLSRSSAQSCASCHSPGLGWGDGLPLAVGHDMKKLERRTPTLINSAWGAIFMWDGSAASLEQQALVPIKGANEMNMPIDQLLERLASIPEYRLLFASGFPGTGMTPTTLFEAIATYERTIVSDRAPFDAWIEGDERAIPETAKRGFAIFNGKGRCSLCHEGWNFTNDGFHDIGLRSADRGRAALLPNFLKMMHAFKTPGLREIKRRGPYMHDGSIATLEEVIEHYDGGGADRPSRSDLIGRLGLTPQDKSDLVAFLETLTSHAGSATMPALPR